MEEPSYQVVVAKVVHPKVVASGCSLGKVKLTETTVNTFHKFSQATQNPFVNLGGLGVWHFMLCGSKVILQFLECKTGGIPYFCKELSASLYLNYIARTYCCRKLCILPHA